VQHGVENLGAPQLTARGGQVFAPMASFKVRETPKKTKKWGGEKRGTNVFMFRNEREEFFKAKKNSILLWGQGDLGESKSISSKELGVNSRREAQR